jgi:polyisoprenyl-phosphate glycosyltransferase
MPASMPLLSVVSPAFEEAEGLEQFHETLAAVFDSLSDRYRAEIIYVDDGSRDDTLAVLRRLSARDQRVRYLSLSRNFGHQMALTAGIEHAGGDAVISLDADGQHPPGLIPTLIQKWETGYDVVQTVRADDKRLGWFKRATSALFYRLMRRWSDLDVRASASDFRLMSRKATDGLLRMRETHRYLRGMVQWLGFAVADVPFQPSERTAGVSKYTLRKMLRLASDGLFSFSRVPMRLSISAGLILTGASFLITLALSILRAGQFDLMFLALAIAIHLIGGSILASLGVLGEYVRRIHEESKGRPLYLLKEAWPAALADGCDTSLTHGDARAA